MQVKPVNYRLEFEPDLKRSAFSGREVVTARAGGPVDRVSLHAAELEIGPCRAECGGRSGEAEARVDAGSEELHVELPFRVRGEFSLEVGFRGVLNDRLLGFYRSRYTAAGRTRYLATTQFEAADARRAFPCWDEPAAKATFDITVTADAVYSAVSNMPAASRRRVAGGRKIRHRFATTPPMPTYLVYLGVGEFEHLSGRAGGTAVRVVTTPGNRSRGRFALDLAKRLLPAYERYFGIRYPLPKLDLLAIPDFAAGAMENWGAITFREAALLYDPATSSARTKQLVAEVVSHEIAHQWFGNLVTMRWWNDLWLNESFATFMATKFVDGIHPEWDLWDQFVGDAMDSAMRLDSLRSTHPIDVEVESPAQIREIFDAISYDKGGCVLRMLERHVGEPAFRRGLRDYLRRFRYGNATGDDLWDSIGRAAGRPVRRMVDTWIRQPGFPVVRVGQEGARVTLEQRRFLLEKRGRRRGGGAGGGGGGLWHIPVEISAAGAGGGGGKAPPPRRHLLRSGSKAVRVPRGSSVLANPGRHGFYRAEYDGGILVDLKMLVDSKGIPHVDRWAVQNDLFALCMSGDCTVGGYLDFADAYLGEDSYLASSDVARNLYSLFLLACRGGGGGGGAAAVIGAHARAHLGAALSRLGWDPRRGERHTDALLRGFAVSALAKLGDGAVAREAGSRFRAFLKDPGSLRPDLREAVFSAVAWGGDARTHSRMASLYRGARTQEEKLRFLGAMCSFGDSRLLARTLDFSQTPAVRSQDVYLPVARVAANPRGGGILWPWIRRNWAGLAARVGRGNPLLNRIVASVGAAADASMEGEIRAFFAENPAPGTERTLEQTLERVRVDSRLTASIRRELGGAGA